MVIEIENGLCHRHEREDLVGPSGDSKHGLLDVSDRVPQLFDHRTFLFMYPFKEL